MRKLFRFSISLFFFTLLVILILPLFIDKEEVIEKLNNKIKDDYGLNISFDKNVDISFIPYPTLKINDLIYLDENTRIDLSVKKLNLITSWRSIFNFDPEIVSLEIYSPYLRINSNKITRSNKIHMYYVNNSINNQFKQIDDILKKIEFIKIADGKIENLQKEGFFFEEIDLTVRGKNKIECVGAFSIKKLFSEFRLSLNGDQLSSLDFILQQKIKNKNKLDYAGKISFERNSLLIDGEVKSKFLDINEFLTSSFSILYMNQDRIFISNDFKLKIKGSLNFKVEKIGFNNFSLVNNQFLLNFDNQSLKIKNYSAKVDNSLVKGEIAYGINNNQLNGVMKISDFFLDEKLYGKTKFDLYDGYASCEIFFSSMLDDYDFEKIIDRTRSEGMCKIGKIKFKGLNLNKLASNVDEIKTLSNLLEFLKFEKFEGTSNLDSIVFNFVIKNSFLRIKDLKAEHKNLKLNSNGKYHIINDQINVDTDAFFKTTKYNNLPPLGINLSGSSKEFKVSYDFDKLKEKLFNESINKILKEQKSIVIDPGSIKDFLKNRKKEKIDPNEIIDFFIN